MPPRRDVRTILFDVGNTLAFLDVTRLHPVFTEFGFSKLPALAEAEASARRTLYANLDDDPRGTDATRWLVYVESILEAAGVRDSAVRRAMTERVHHEHRSFNLWRKVPEGTQETLADLSARGFQLGVVSNADGRVHRLLDDLGLSRWFGVIVDSHVVGIEKPDPRIFQIALDHFEADPRTSAYVGDFPAVDVIGAERAGIWPILLDPLELSGDEAGTVIRELPDLLPLLTGGMEQRAITESA